MDRRPQFFDSAVEGVQPLLVAMDLKLRAWLSQ
jgi:hypothetical protein